MSILDERNLDITPYINSFWSRVLKRSPEECWNRVEFRSDANFKFPYGQIEVGKTDKGSRKRILMHRFSWILHYGPVPDNLQVLHKCDNPRCVNPNHLFLGTHVSNMSDKKDKGRGKHSEETREKIREASYRRYR